jgi:hypothetical protein
MRLIWMIPLLAASLFADPAHLPLKNGNTWMYRERGGQSTFTVQIGAPSSIGGVVYHRLTGYATEPLWVRFGADGALYFRDEAGDRDVLLTSFGPAGSGFPAPLRPCEQTGEVQPDPGEHSGPAGPFTTLVIRYRVSGCADNGIAEEQYAANLGMVGRTVITIAGPRSYDLVSARIGAEANATTEGAAFTVTTEKLSGVLGVVATLDLNTTGPTPVKLRYLSSQEYDLVLRNEEGTAVWRWSEGRAFLPVIRDEVVSRRSWQVTVPLTDRTGAILPPGLYELEAWILSGVDRPQFSGVSRFRIPE